MQNSQQKSQAQPKQISWQVPEYEKHERGQMWYIIAGTIAGIGLLWAVFSYNFLFALVIILAAIIIVLTDGRHPDLITVKLDGDGVQIGSKFYDYDEIKNFSVIYKPKIGVKNLYFEFKNPLKHHLSIPLQKTNPLLVRQFLLKYLEEDLERTDPPLSEQLAKLLKI